MTATQISTNTTAAPLCSNVTEDPDFFQRDNYRLLADNYFQPQSKQDKQWHKSVIHVIS